MGGPSYIPPTHLLNSLPLPTNLRPLYVEPPHPLWIGHLLLYYTTSYSRSIVILPAAYMDSPSQGRSRLSWFAPEEV